MDREIERKRERGLFRMGMRRMRRGYGVDRCALMRFGLISARTKTRAHTHTHTDKSDSQYIYYLLLYVTLWWRKDIFLISL